MATLMAQMATAAATDTEVATAVAVVTVALEATECRTSELTCKSRTLVIYMLAHGRIRC